MATINPQKSGTPALRILAKREGFRRAGYAFGAEPVVIPVADLSPAQIKSLRSEPMLLVTDAEVPAPAKDGAP